MDDIVALRGDCDFQNSQLRAFHWEIRQVEAKLNRFSKLHESIRKFILAFKDEYSGFERVAWLNCDKHSGDPDVEVLNS